MTDRSSDGTHSDATEPTAWRVQTDRREVLTHTDTEGAVEALDRLDSGVDATGDERTVPESRVGESPSEAVRSFLRCVPSLLSWAEANGREFPWRPTDDPWRVYVVEVLLQRTRAEAVASIYPEFFETYPTPEAIVEADESDLIECVSPLGFGRRRASILRSVARAVVEDHDGAVPRDAPALREPDGIGPYTARATAVFGHGTPLGLVDVNTARIFGRVFGREVPRRADESDPAHLLADSLTPSIPRVARAFNLALLDLGAMVCTPSDPNCSSCPLVSACAHARECRSENADGTDGDGTGTDTAPDGCKGVSSADARPEGDEA